MRSLVSLKKVRHHPDHHTLFFALLHKGHTPYHILSSSILVSFLFLGGIISCNVALAEHFSSSHRLKANCSRVSQLFILLLGAVCEEASAVSQDRLCKLAQCVCWSLKGHVCWGVCCLWYTALLELPDDRLGNVRVEVADSQHTVGHLIIKNWVHNHFCNLLVYTTTLQLIYASTHWYEIKLNLKKIQILWY